MGVAQFLPPDPWAEHREQQLRDELPSQEQIAFAAALEAKAIEWIANISTFELTHKGALLEQSRCPALPFLYSSTRTKDDFGLNFSRAILPTDTVAVIQEALTFVVVGHIRVPGLDEPDSWTISARPPKVTFKPGDSGQKVIIEHFDGSKLRFSVESLHFCAIRGEMYGAGFCEAAAHSVGTFRPVPGKSFECCGNFRGSIRFESNLRNGEA